MHQYFQFSEIKKETEKIIQENLEINIFITHEYESMNL